MSAPSNMIEHRLVLPAGCHRNRRGNTLVLVTAILVLLVIIATAFISRTQGTRTVTSAQQRSFQREDHAQLVGEQIAAEIAQSLFPRPVDPYVQAEAVGFGADIEGWLNGGAAGETIASRTWSGVPRASSGNDPARRFTAERFQPDPGDYYTFDAAGAALEGDDGIPDGIMDFNFAPFEVRAFTNYPDDPNGLLPDIPYGPGAPSSNARRVDDTAAGLALGVGNPHGNPGFGDFRLLRDTEPRRLGAYYDGPNELQGNQDPYSEFFTHWTHLSWVPTAENGWRVCYDISNVAPLDAFLYPGGALGPENGNTLSSYAYEGGVPYPQIGFPAALQTPYEQWYPNVIPQRVDPVYDGSIFQIPNIFVPPGTALPGDPGPADYFAALRGYWFGTPQDHFAIAASNYALPNFIDLARLKFAEEFMRLEGIRQDDEQFTEESLRIGQFRREVENTFCDTDGDGFTDSLWFVPPTPVDRGVRQVVGISVVDNGGLLDANVATVFDRWSTSGATPSDLALVSRLGFGDGGTGFDVDEQDTHVGMLVDPKNTVDDAFFFPSFDGSVVQRFRIDRWGARADPDVPTFLNMRGITDLIEPAAGVAGPFFGQYRAVVSGFGKDDPAIAERERRLWNRAAQRDGEGLHIEEQNDGSLRLVPFTTTPFGLSDELELRAHSGQNNSKIYSRFERAIDDVFLLAPNPGWGNRQRTMLRSSINRDETTPIQIYDGNGIPTTGNLTNTQLTRDARHRMTLLSGTRNELRPMWLWATPFFDISVDYDGDTIPNGPGDFAEYERRKRKIDLRQSYALPAEITSVDASSPLFPARQGTPRWNEYQRVWLNDLQETIALTMAYQEDVDNSTTWQSYFSSPLSTIESGEAPAAGARYQTDPFDAYRASQLASASLTANIESFRDGPTQGYAYWQINPDDPLTEPAPDADELDDVVLVDPMLHPFRARRVERIFNPNDPSDQPLLPTDPNYFEPEGFVGLEKQPFIMQTFFGLVYPKSHHEEGPEVAGSEVWEAGYEIPEGPDGPFLGGFPDEGENYVDDTSRPAIVLAVQIGNPFNEPISLADYSLRIGDSGAPSTQEFLWFSQMECPHPVMDSVSGAEKSGFGGYRLKDLVLGPTEPDAPRSAIVFAVIPPRRDTTTPGPGGSPDTDWWGASWDDPNRKDIGDLVGYEQFRDAIIAQFDLEEGDLFGYEEDMPPAYHQTLVLDASRLMHQKLPANNSSRVDAVFDTNDHVIELIRQAIDPQGSVPPVGVVVDRLDHDRDDVDDPRIVEFTNTLATLIDEGSGFSTGDPDSYIPPEGRGVQGNYEIDANDTNGDGEPETIEGLNWAGIRLGDDDFFMTWARVSRIWGWDSNASGMIDMNEVNPRYVFSAVSDPAVPADNFDGVLVAEENAGWEEENDLYSTETYLGDTFSISDLTGSEPDLIDPIDRVLPVTRPSVANSLPGNWTWENAPPDAWTVSGKPTNFPLWTVLNDAGTAVDYTQEGFPIKVEPSAGNWSLAGGYELELREPGITQRDVIPMDLVATEQEDFFEGFRKDLWFGPLQMLLKDDDFEQVGELSHVFLWGPVLELPTAFDIQTPGSGAWSPPGLIGTATANYAVKRTFAEVMTEVASHQDGLLDDSYTSGGYDFPDTLADEYPVGRGLLVNRLDIDLGFNDPGAETMQERPWRQVLGGRIDSTVPAFRPRLPAGVGLFDAVTVDGRGLNAPHPDFNDDDFYSLDEALRAEVDRYDLVRGYSGKATKGLVNVNTAPVEVLRCLPQMSRVVYNDYFEDSGYSNVRGQYGRSATGTPAGEDAFGANFSNLKHVRLAETIDRYRLGDAQDRFAVAFQDGEAVPQPSMADRGYVGQDFGGVANTNLYPQINGYYGYFPGMRTERGIVSLGELLTMQRSSFEEFELTNGGSAPANGGRWLYRNNGVRGLALDPYADVGLGWGFSPESDAYARERFFLGWRDVSGNEYPNFGTGAGTAFQADARVSTDRNTLRRTLLGRREVANAPTTEFAPDNVGGDAEEMNLLFSGIANMITTRSDVFTVYMTIRTFEQDPVSGIWDASKKANIIDESRYLVVVDRSEVEAPTDKPKILAFSKIE